MLGGSIVSFTISNSKQSVSSRLEGGGELGEPCSISAAESEIPSTNMKSRTKPL
jgi:hypothetical protein